MLNSNPRNFTLKYLLKICLSRIENQAFISNALKSRVKLKYDMLIEIVSIYKKLNFYFTKL